MNQQYHVSRYKFSDVKVQSYEKSPLATGQVRLAIDKFALTSNNITYAVVGETVGYWKFFPVKDTSWGIVPVWGFANVVESEHPSIAKDERYYGFYPMSNTLIVKPTRINPLGFSDGMEHREQLPPIYNFYTSTGSDPSYSQDQENYQIIFKPLFATAFLLDDFLVENRFFNAKQVVITSSSSKTAIALAQLLLERGRRDSPIRTIGLTSSKNRDFVKSLGCYTDVHTYDSIQHISNDTSAVVVDFSGNSDLLIGLSNHLKKNLCFVSKVGMVHHEKYDAGLDLGEKSQFFFAPSQARKRSKEWGHEVFNQRLDAAWKSFVTFVSTWMDIVEINKMDQFEQIYKRMVIGNIDPKKGYIINYSQF